MLTILSVPFAKPDDATKIRQRNAIESWKRLEPQPEILLLDEKDIAPTTVGGLSIRSILALGDKLALHDLIAYVDSDIILMSDFMPVVKTLDMRYKKWVSCAGRWSARIDFEVDFEQADWEETVRSLVYRQHNKGSDYFVYRRGFFANVPDFCIGQGHWDGWRMRYVLDRKYSSINIQDVVKAVHQDHGPRWRVAPQKDHNKQLAGQTAWVTDATIKLTYEDLQCS